MPYRSGKYVGLLFVLLLLSGVGLSPIHAQNTQYRVFNESLGLNRHSIFDIVKDDQGYYWLGTEKGIIRFDGANFIDIPAPKPYSNESIRKLYVHKNSLYIVYTRQGCAKFDLTNYQYTIVSDLTITGITVKDDDTVILTDKLGNLYTYVSGKLLLKLKLDAQHYDHPLFIKNNRLFIHALNKGLLVIDLNNYQILKNLGLQTSQVAHHFVPTSEKLYFLGDFNLYEITSELDLKKIKNPGLTENTLSYLAVLNKQHFYFINRSKLIFKVKDDKQSLIDLHHLENAEMRKILIHDPNTILVATNIGLLMVQTGTSPINSISDNAINSTNQLRIRRKIIPLSNDEYLLFGYPQNFRYKNGQFKSFKMNTTSSYDAIKVGSDVYFTTENNGVFKYNIQTEKVNPLTNSVFKTNNSIYSIAYVEDDSALVFGSRKNLIYKSLKTNIVKQIKLPIQYSFLQTITYDTKGKKYWLGTDSGLVCLNKQFKPINIIGKTADQSKILDVSDILIREDQAWIAHRYGIDILHSNTYKLLHQLPESFFDNPVVTSLGEDKQGKIWISTYDGIYGYDPQIKASIRLGSKNLLINTEYNFKSFCLLPNGNIIFGGLTGYDIIDPSTFTFNRSRDIGLITGYERIAADTSEFYPLADQISTIQFDIDKESIRIYLAAKGQIDSRFNRYEYRLNNEGWISLKGTSFLNIYKLDPGLYKIQIRGYDEYGGIINFNPIYINATVVFYKNRYFIWALFLLSSTLIILVVWNEVKRKKIEAKIKEKISMDLHDEVGTILTRTLLIANTQHIPQKEERIKEYLSEALYSLRVYINTMNKHSFSIYELGDEMREMVVKTFSDPTYNVDLIVNINEDIKIKSEKYRDMKLCFFEIVSNILKHSNGKNITLQLDASPLLIKFKVKDDGTLTNINDIEEKGNGIQNIRKRVKKHKGLANFAIPESGHGLEINLICPQ